MKRTYTIDGMHCDSCAKIIEMELKDKVKSISIDADKKNALIDFDEKKISEKEIRSIIEKLGYKISKK